MSSPRIVAAGVRPAWEELPAAVRAGVEDVLGAPVVAAVNQSGGFSPGLAARVRCEDGSRAFVKAVGTPLNPESPGIYRAEAAVVARMPTEAPVPRLRGTHDDGDWVALVFDEVVDGRMPHDPWRADELRAVVDAVVELAETLTPCPVPDLRPASAAMRGEMLCYRELAADPPGDLDPWERRHLDRLADLARSALDHVDGDALVHFDLRADNVLLEGSRVWFVDWPWAFRGAAWIDSATLLINAAYHGHDPEPYLDGHPLIAGADPEHVTALLAGMTGFFGAYARRPAPPGLPTLREFQRTQHATTLAWVRRRTGWE
ncbi:phosphotransferase [Jiangella asiatica]|uniref:Aminoglycoside phosphotransferase family protein n=1 Tax=Jiangella asiatica TaxID=2530372 RepID=A0A4R5CIA9_9ACTN|nr:phosphotransferase [Jiangella asiatica]TDD98839.1 aminoglycoside phosphotransferase family protein [Jiangella asiatica]